MKQISLRMDDEVHGVLTEEARLLNKSLTQHILDLTYKRGDLSTTNYHHRIQARFNLTYLGDLLVLGRRASFDGMYAVMKEAIENGEKVILERHYDNFPPSILGEINTLKELEEWRENILYIEKKS